jgi:hypothetical protein
MLATFLQLDVDWLLGLLNFPAEGFAKIIKTKMNFQIIFNVNESVLSVSPKEKECRMVGLPL